MYNLIKQQANDAIYELIKLAKLEKNDILVIGCSSSEVVGHKIGTFSSIEAANAIFEGVYAPLKEHGIFLAAQCCEHLNRAVIIEKDAMNLYNLEQINVIPQPKAGGSFATTVYNNLSNAVAVEEIKADAGIDIGGTLIGMHLKKVAVPVRLKTLKIGDANIICARTRLKFIGGNRTSYDENLM